MDFKKASLVFVFVVLISCFNVEIIAKDKPESGKALRDILKACEILKERYVGEVSYPTLYSGALRGAQEFLLDKGYILKINEIGKHNSDSSARAQLCSKFTLILNLAQEKGISAKEVVFAASSGAAKAINSGHTRFIYPELADAPRIVGCYSGLGVRLAKVGNFIFLKIVLADSPAELAGLRKFDILREIDNKPAPSDLNECVRLLSGKDGAKVSVKVMRFGKVIDKPFVVWRSSLSLPYCITRIFGYCGKKLGYVFLRTFSLDSYEMTSGFNEVAEFVNNNELDGVVVDLRGNFGGDTSVLRQILALFFESSRFEKIIDIKTRLNREVLYTDCLMPLAGCAAKTPMVVLVDEMSYSGSEIFAGFVQESGRGKVVGKNTGGSVELGRFSYFEQQDEDTYFLITEGTVTLPSGAVLEGLGVRPDFCVLLTEDDILLGRDSQLEAALYFLEKEIRNKKK